MNRITKINPKKLKKIGFILIGIGLLGTMISTAYLSTNMTKYSGWYSYYNSTSNSFNSTFNPLYTPNIFIPFLISIISFYFLFPAGVIFLILGFLKSWKQNRELLNVKISPYFENPSQKINTNLSQPNKEQTTIQQEIIKEKNIFDKITINLQVFRKQHPTLNMRDIEDLLKTTDDQSIKKAEILLSQRKKDYEHYIKTENNLKETNARINNLTKRLADGNIDSDAYKTARDDLEQEKKRLEEELWKLRSILFKDEYEKPF
jgi:hypothetical protein